jgi:hypothetical protein
VLVRGAWRFFAFEVGTPLLDLDQDGVVEAIESAPARLDASNAFARGATTTPLSIFICRPCTPEDGWQSQSSRQC